MSRPEYVQVHLKPGDKVWAFDSTRAMHDCMYGHGGVLYTVAIINTECTVPMFRMAAPQTAGNISMPAAYFYYSVLPKDIIHPKYGTVKAWGYWSIYDHN